MQPAHLQQEKMSSPKQDNRLLLLQEMAQAKQQDFLQKFPLGKIVKKE